MPENNQNQSVQFPTMQSQTNAVSSRRHFLASNAMGIAGIAAATMMRDQGIAFGEEIARPELAQKHFDLLPKKPPQKATAKAMISFWMSGGPSHIDLFDPKPVLDKLDGTDYKGDIKYDNAADASPLLRKSPWKFKKHGESGIELSELLPYLGQVADNITVIRSMKTGVNNHVQSIRAMQTGRILAGRPTLGGWLTYGLGCETQNLPAYVALANPSSLPTDGVKNWSNGFLPSLYQGTVVRPTEPRILNLDPAPQLAGQPQENALNFLKKMNQKHLEQRQGYHDLEARMISYELAAHMQDSAKEAMDLSKETKATHKMYGLDDPKTREYGSRCLIARRLVERGVRFVQLFVNGQIWDDHNSIATNLPTKCQMTDKPTAALVADLKQRGMLDETVVHWGGEMGRLPVVQTGKTPKLFGRDHNTNGFSMWVAGGGFKEGHVYGATDDIGLHAVEDIVHHYDYHTTLLHMFGFDAETFVFEQSNTKKSLVDNQAGRIVKEILKST